MVLCLNRAKAGGCENKMCANDRDHVPGIYTGTTLWDIDENAVARELFGDGDAYLFGFEITCGPKFSAGKNHGKTSLKNGCAIRLDKAMFQILVEA
jgi:hypothetical protein